VDSINALSTEYGPIAKEAAFEVTAVELEAYAPPSSKIRMRTLTSFPALVARCSARATWSRSTCSHCVAT
jgi:hypothetical protein